MNGFVHLLLQTALGLAGGLAMILVVLTIAIVATKYVFWLAKKLGVV